MRDEGKPELTEMGRTEGNFEQKERSLVGT